MDFLEIKEFVPGPVISILFRQMGFHDTINQMLT